MYLRNRKRDLAALELIRIDKLLEAADADTCHLDDAIKFLQIEIAQIEDYEEDYKRRHILFA